MALIEMAPLAVGIPSPRPSVENQVDLMTHRSDSVAPFEAGAMLAESHRPHLVFDNKSTYAYVVDAREPGVLHRIQENKQNDGEHNLQDAGVQAAIRRDSKQPIGLTVRFEDSLDLVNIDAIEDPKTQALLRDPELLTNLYGALGFVRAPASMVAKLRRRIPDSVVPRQGRQIQLYSPAGNRAAETFIDGAVAAGVLPAMTSVNRTGEPEITSYEQALDFAGQRFMPLIVNQLDEEKPAKPKGSYPIWTVEAGRMVITRPGWLHPDVIKALFSDYPVEVAADGVRQDPKHPEGVLTFADLPPDVRSLKNQELRLGILATTGLAA